jgi:hypothetical protein
MDETQQKIAQGLIFWGITIAGLYVCNRKKKLAGLMYIWLCDLAVNHLFGGLIYLVPNYFPESGYLKNFTAEHTTTGFWITSLGLLGFLAGAAVIAPMIIRFMKPGCVSSQPDYSLRLPQQLIAVGCFFYFILRFLQSIPSLGTLSQSGWLLAQAGVCLCVRNAYFQKNKKLFIVWLIAGLVFFPAFILIFTGFLGFGIKVMLIILCFTGLYYRDKWKLLILAPLLLWFGLSVYVNYSLAKEDIRDVVWGGADLKSRVSVIQKAFAEPQVFNVTNVEHLDLINVRLNQNCLVGLGVEYLANGGNEFARGKTILGAVVAMIPRILWKNKPVVGGGGSLVMDYTGFIVAEGTSYGVGLPLELYINFGTGGVVIGFLLLGVLMSIYDRRAGHALQQNNVKEFLWFFLPGLAFTATLCSLAEYTTSFAAMYVFLLLINQFVFKSHRRFLVPANTGKALDRIPQVKR